MEEILSLVKECLGIIPTATAKDNEIQLLIDTAIADMERLNITIDLANPMQQSAIIQYVKSNFGMLDEKVKELSFNSYNLLVSSLQMDSRE